MNDRTRTITIGGQARPALLTVRAAKVLTESYGGLTETVEALTGDAPFEKKKPILANVLSLLMSEGAKSENYFNGNDYYKQIATQFTEDSISSENLGFLIFQTALVIRAGAERYVLTKKEKQIAEFEKLKAELNADSEETAGEDPEGPRAGYSQWIFIGVTLLRRPEREVWLMPLGALADQYALFKIYTGQDTAKEETIDDVLDGLE